MTHIQTYWRWSPENSSSSLVEATACHLSFCQKVKYFDRIWGQITWAVYILSHYHSYLYVHCYMYLCFRLFPCCFCIFHWCNKILFCCVSVCVLRSSAVVTIRCDSHDTSRPMIGPAWKENRHSGSGVCNTYHNTSANPEHLWRLELGPRQTHKDLEKGRLWVNFEYTRR